MYNQNENVPFVWPNASRQQNDETYRPDDEALSQSPDYGQPYMPIGAYEEYSRYGTGTEATLPNMQGPERQPIVNYPMVSKKHAYQYCKCFVILNLLCERIKRVNIIQIGSLTGLLLAHNILLRRRINHYTTTPARVVVLTNLMRPALIHSKHLNLQPLRVIGQHRITIARSILTNHEVIAPRHSTQI